MKDLIRTPTERKEKEDADILLLRILADPVTAILGRCAVLLKHLTLMAKGDD